jgi:uncharacterized Zn finger protein
MTKKKQATSLEKVLNRDTLLERAGDRYFTRGENYFRQGAVHEISLDGNGISAEVHGSQEYDVELWVEEDELQASCTCPLGADDLFCKHCVAVGLAWLANPNSPQPQKNHPPAQKPVTMDEVQIFLEQQEKSTLIQWILDQAKQDEDWKQYFVLKVASSRPQGIDPKIFQRALREAIDNGDFIEWNQTYDYTDKIQTVLGSIEDLIEAHPQTVMELCEYALSLFESALNSVDDSSGDVGMVVEDFQTLHYKACELAHPDPIALAERLLQSELNSGFGIFSSAVKTYAPILGDAGLAHYRQQVEAMWADVPPLTSKDASKFDFKRSKLQVILESLAKLSGDLEGLVEVKRRDLSRPHTYLAIAQLYLENGQCDRALEWAESGLKAFDFFNPSLQKFVIEEYYRRGRNEEAMELVWQAFTQSITLHSYQELKAYVERTDQWEPWRDRALTHIRQLLEPPPAVTQTGRTSKNNLNAVQKIQTGARRSPALFGIRHSILVEIFLWEGEEELAWQEAQAGGCSQSLWFKLAELRQQDHPADVLPIYKNEIEPLIQQTNNASYANAISMLHKVHDLMVRLDQQAEFNAFVEHLWTTYKAKRNFIALLNKQKW